MGHDAVRLRQIEGIAACEAQANWHSYRTPTQLSTRRLSSPGKSMVFALAI